MKLPVIVDDSGDHAVFTSVAALENYLEPWFVDEPHSIFDSEGLELAIAPTAHGVHLTPKEPRATKPAVARRHFEAFLLSIAHAKGWDFVGSPEEVIKSASLSELTQISTKFASR